MNPGTRNLACQFVLFLNLAMPVAEAQQDQTPPVGEREALRTAMPPAEWNCAHDQLTSYSGIVSRYSRMPGALEMTVSTDRGTEESISIVKTSGDFRLYFLLFSRAFREENWPVIETEAGRLQPGVRATVWVCLDGVTPPLVDWQPGYAEPARRERGSNQP